MSRNELNNLFLLPRVFFPLIFAVSLFLVFVSLSVHEFSHAAVATHFGDPTAKNQGRLTLNPLKHIDPFGTIILPLFLLMASEVSEGIVPIFGYAIYCPRNSRI